MKILIYGSDGWIGTQFINILKNNNINFEKGKSRCDNFKNLNTEIELINPSHIISFIGRTHGNIGNTKYTTIDYLEQPGKLKENINDNLYSPLLLSHICNLKGIHYTYLGTGCIFKYDESHPFEKEDNGFREEDEPNFFGSSYSIVKGFTDRLIGLNHNVLNLRIRMPITGEENPRNFITKIINYKKICSIKNSMTVLPELLPLVFDMMKNKKTGTINLTNPGLISHNEILEMYKEIVDPSFVYENFSQEEQRKILQCDRSNNFLDTTKLQEMFPNIRNIKESVKDCLYSYKEYLQNNPRRRNLLITGGCGFIGSNFINHIFQSKKYNIINIDAMYYCASESNITDEIRKSPYYHFIKGNINDKELVRKILTDYKIIHIIHFAAQSHVDNSFSLPLQYTYDNVQGTHTLLEEVRVYNRIERFIHVSTDEVYGESMIEIDEAHKTEQSVLCPTNPYAASKAGAELIAQSYNHSFKLPIIITRGNNVYGPNQYPEKLVPKFIKLLEENKKVTIHGNGSTLRAFVHAYDTVKAFEIILEKGKIGEIYNIGCDEGMEYSVLNVAQILIKMIKNTDNYDEWIQYVEDRLYNDKRYYISNNKLKQLGWDIKIKFEDGLKNLINKEKIEKKLLLEFNNISHLSKFGDWINNINILKNEYKNALPFEHIIINNFLNEEYINKIYEEFPTNFDSWYKYYNPIEIKYANDDINNMGQNIKDLFYTLCTDEAIDMFKRISGIFNLEYDPYLHGAGLHTHPRNGRLNMHLDYEKHPYLEKERRLNIILYLSKDWKEEWNGHTELWDKDMKECVKKSPVKFNTAIIFKTNEISYHGLPEKIKCPLGEYRKSFAFYYISDIITERNENIIGNDGSGYRTKATFVKRPNDPDYPQLKKLYEIRPLRRIEEKDMKEIWPEWNETL
jgi:dTDP-glucose 4,6-dehydratase